MGAGRVASKSTTSPLWIGAVLLVLVAAAVLLVTLDVDDDVDVAAAAARGEARVDASGVYPDFDAEATLVRTLTLAGTSRLAVTPPFPSRVELDVVVPASGVLELSTALVMMQQVERARVRFEVGIVADGAPTIVADEVRTITDANRWQPLRVDVSGWSGAQATLTLATSVSPAPRDVPWASRVQIAWGDIRLRSGGSPVAPTDPTLEWLGARAEEWGVDVGDRASLERYVVNLALAGLASLVVGWVYRRLAGDGGGDVGLSRSFVMFTLTATFVVAVLRSSVALSLGLLGALSILRFRTPMRTAEQLLGVLGCVAVALAFGTDQGLLGVVAVGAFAAVMWFRRMRAPASRRFLVTASGPAAGGAGLLRHIDDVDGDVTIDSYDVHGGVVSVRARVEVSEGVPPMSLLADACSALPDFRISFEAVEGP